MKYEILLNQQIEDIICKKKTNRRYEDFRYMELGENMILLHVNDNFALQSVSIHQGDECLMKSITFIYLMRMFYLGTRVHSSHIVFGNSV